MLAIVPCQVNFFNRAFTSFVAACFFNASNGERMESTSCDITTKSHSNGDHIYHACHIVMVKNMPQVLPILNRKDLHTGGKTRRWDLGDTFQSVPRALWSEIWATILPPPFYGWRRYRWRGRKLQRATMDRTASMASLQRWSLGIDVNTWRNQRCKTNMECLVRNCAKYTLIESREYALQWMIAPCILKWWPRH